VAANQLWFKQSGNDLVAEIMGTHDQVTVVNWFGAAASQLQEITTADGSKLDGQLSQLVQAMATYGAANPGFDPTAAIQAPGIPRCKAPSPPPGTIDSRTASRAGACNYRFIGEPRPKGGQALVRATKNA
jgi:hypothetical protein